MCPGGVWSSGGKRHIGERWNSIASWDGSRRHATGALDHSFGVSRCAGDKPGCLFWAVCYLAWVWYLGGYLKMPLAGGRQPGQQQLHAAAKKHLNILTAQDHQTGRCRLDSCGRIWIRSGDRMGLHDRKILKLKAEDRIQDPCGYSGRTEF